ncbi:MAG: DUF3794 domain-containing protein, partial [Firmicutes bacterium]|nr:DUF3794 domain-containing protein [Bacillota bacterium]
AEIPDPKPNVTKVLEKKVDKTEVTETKILDSKVLVRGHVEVEVVYVSDKPSQAVHALHKRLNFSTFVVIPGAKPGMDVDVEVEAEYVNVEAGKPDLPIEVVLKVRPAVTEMKQISVYVPEEEEEEITTPCPPISYTVKSGDTLGKIAREYGTTVNMILALNPQITDRDVIEVGQVIKVPCVAKG